MNKAITLGRGFGWLNPSRVDVKSYSNGKIKEVFFKKKWIDWLIRNSKVDIVGNVLAILENPITKQKLLMHGVNIVTNKGDVYYAESICAETPTDDFDGASSGIRLGSAVTGPTKTDNDVTTFLAGTGKGLEATYPMTSDTDGDNTGSGTDIASWKYAYTTAQGNATGIQEGAIVDDITTPTGALTHFLFAASFNKTSSDTLKVFVNHECLGV